MHFVAQYLEEGGGVEPLPINQYLFSGVWVPFGYQTLFVSKDGTFQIRLSFSTGEPALRDRTSRNTTKIGAARENRTPLSTAWKAEDAPRA